MYVIRYVDIDKTTGTTRDCGGVSTATYERKGNAERAKRKFEFENERYVRCIWVAEVKFKEDGEWIV